MFKIHLLKILKDELNILTRPLFLKPHLLMIRFTVNNITAKNKQASFILQYNVFHNMTSVDSAAIPLKMQVVMNPCN